ncbi:MAG: hypothetical protein ACRD99_05735 [Nitrososphaera sp.]
MELSAAKNKKLMAAIGGAPIIAGMVVVGQGAISTVTTGGFSDPGEGRSVQLGEHVFLFMLVEGLIIMIHPPGGLQRDRVKAGVSRCFNPISDIDANA